MIGIIMRRILSELENALKNYVGLPLGPGALLFFIEKKKAVEGISDIEIGW